MDQKGWEKIIHQVLDLVSGFDEFFDEEYAVLKINDENDVILEQLPSPGESLWGKELPWAMVGLVKGKGLDGIEIDLEYDGFSYHEEGYFNLPHLDENEVE